MDKRCCVYCHTNKENGKRYIGITSNIPSVRWANGNGYKHNAYFTSAIKKYGWKNFEHEIILADIDEETAKALEKMLIGLYRTNDREYGYNLSDGGEPMSGKKHSEETKRKMSESAKGRKLSDETKSKISQIMKERSPELKYKFAHSHDGKAPWNKGLSKELNPNFGKKYSKERRLHISQSLKGKPKSPQHIANMCKKVRCLSDGKVYNSVTEASTLNGISMNAVIYHCKGYSLNPKWEYVKEN